MIAEACGPPLRCSLNASAAPLTEGVPLWRVASKIAGHRDTKPAPALARDPKPGADVEPDRWAEQVDVERQRVVLLRRLEHEPRSARLRFQ